MKGHTLTVQYNGMERSYINCTILMYNERSYINCAITKYNGMERSYMYINCKILMYNEKDHTLTVR